MCSSRPSIPTGRQRPDRAHPCGVDLPCDGSISRRAATDQRMLIVRRSGRLLLRSLRSSEPGRSIVGWMVRQHHSSRLKSTLDFVDRVTALMDDWRETRPRSARRCRCPFRTRTLAVVSGSERRASSRSNFRGISTRRADLHLDVLTSRGRSPSHSDVKPSRPGRPPQWWLRANFPSSTPSALGHNDRAPALAGAGRRATSVNPDANWSKSRRTARRERPSPVAPLPDGEGHPGRAQRAPRQTITAG